MSDPVPIADADVLSRLRAHYPSLSPSEKKVADFILNSFESVLRMTLAELAQNSGVSDATAVRFYRSIGYDSFLALKLALSRAIPDSPRLVHDGIEDGDSPYMMASKVLQDCVQAINDTVAVLDNERFTQALDLLRRAQRILIAGVGTSGPMAQELYNRLFRLRLNCQVQTDGPLLLMQAALLTEHDALVVISQSGESQYSNRAAAEARLHGCPVICITGNALSQLAMRADVVLLSVAHEVRPETITSRVAQHALIQALYVVLAMQSVKETNEAERKIWDALTRYPSATGLCVDDGAR